MAVIHDLIEISGLFFQSELTFANGGLIDVFDNVEKIRNSGDPDSEYNNGDTIIVEGTSYTINEIYHPDDNASRITSDNGVTTIADRGDDDVDMLILEVRNGSDWRYFLIPGDTLGDLPNISSIYLGRFDDAAGNDATLDAFSNDIVTVCFVQGTRIETATGERRVETLVAGDLVRTMDNGFQPIRWIGSQSLIPAALAAKPELRAIRIRKGALGAGLPKRDLLVSRHHRLLSRSKIARNLFGQSEVLVAAKELVFLTGIDVATDLVQVEYWHFLLDDHQVVYAEGAPAESLFVGPQALRALTSAPHRTGWSRMPDMAKPALKGAMARPEVTGRHARHFARKHQLKNRALFADL